MGCCIPQLAGDLLRTFVCITIPEVQKQSLTEWINDRRKNSDGIRWVEPSTLHITLKFCGERLPETVDALKENIKNIKLQGPFKIALNGCGGFPDLIKPRVIWTGIIGETVRLAELSAAVESAANKAGIPKEKRPYSPHLTLGRCGFSSRLPVSVKNDIDSHPIALEPWTVDEIILMKSRLLPRGPEYTPLGLFKI
jgi:2'-5' RNA ligase